VPRSQFHGRRGLDGAFEVQVQFGLGQGGHWRGQRFGGRKVRGGHGYCRGSAGRPALIQEVSQ